MSRVVLCIVLALSIVGAEALGGPPKDCKHAETLRQAAECTGKFMGSLVENKELPDADFRALGLAGREDWVSVAVGFPGNEGFEVFVESAAPLAAEDEAEILRRFADFERTVREIREARKKYEDAEGVFHMPSFTGGGGYGLLACIAAAREAGLFLDYVPRQGPPRTADFRLATFPRAP